METNGLIHYNSDGCSFPNWLNWLRKRIVDYAAYICCVFHDLDYKMWWMTRRQADLNLKHNLEKKGHPKLALMFYSAVRSFGWMFKTKK